MANWQSTLDIQEEWQKTGDGDMSCQELAGIIAKRLKSLKLPHVVKSNEIVMEERQELIEEFEGLSEDSSANNNDIDNVMASLYDWGDISLDNDWPHKKVCWIKTF